MNVKLLEEIKTAILAEPKQFIMDDYFSTYRPVNRHYGADAPRDVIPNCGTAACIAGWAVALSVKMNPATVRENLRSRYTNADELATKALEVSFDQSRRLFQLMQWPSEFYRRYIGAATPEEQAEIASQRINHFIATGE